MTPSERIAALEAAARRAVSCPHLGEASDRLGWLVSQVDLILPGEKALLSRLFSGENWADSLRWIGRDGQGIELIYGAPYGQRSFTIIRVAGLPGTEFQFETDAQDQVLQAMIISGL